MDPDQVSADPLVKGGNVSQDCVKKNLGVVESKNLVVQLPPLSMAAATAPYSLGPVTPDSSKENRASPLCDFTSPLKCVSSRTEAISLGSDQVNDACFSNDDCPCTPKQHVFDAFTPGSHDLLLVPHCSKNLEESRFNVSRRLSFIPSVKFVSNGNGSTTDIHDQTTSDDDELLFKTVYGTLLEAIISMQTEEFLADGSTLDSSPDGFKTPPCASCLNGTVETCPGAPIKPVRKLKEIDPDLCRKLEF